VTGAEMEGRWSMMKKVRVVAMAADVVAVDAGVG
jgi:hypothetical protein